MKCYCCGNEIPGGLAKCPVCSFRAVMVLDENRQLLQEVKEAAAQYRQERLKGVSVSVTVYQNKDLETTGEARTEVIPLVKGLDLEKREILWFQENFARVSGNCPLLLTVKDIRGNTRQITAEVPNPQTDGFWKIGILPQDGFTFQAVVGEATRYAKSAPVSYC